MKKIILVICILCICIPAYSAIKDQSIFEKSINLLQSIRSSAVNLEATLKISENTILSLINSYAKDIDINKNIISSKDKTNIEQIQVKLNNTLVALNELISSIDTLYPEIK